MDRSSKSQLPADPVAFQVFNEIGIIEQLGRNRLERVLPDGLRMAQFTLLNHMVRMGDGWSPHRLARAMQVTKGAMTNTLRRLEARGAVRVDPDPDDGRGKHVYLTETGRELRQQCIAAVGPLLAELGADFADAEFEAVLPFLKKIRAWFDATRPDIPESPPPGAP